MQFRMEKNQTRKKDTHTNKYNIQSSLMLEDVDAFFSCVRSHCDCTIDDFFSPFFMHDFAFTAYFFRFDALNESATVV